MNLTSSKLSYAVRLPVLAKYLGLLAFMLSLLTLPPLVVAVLSQGYTIALRYLIVIALLLLFWWASRSLTEPRKIQTNEALTIVALAFVCSPLLMTIPFTGFGLPFIDALFEAVSAVTTTGLSVVTDLQDKPDAFLFGRSWVQWYGGLGIVVLSVALLMGHQVTSRSLSEPLGGDTLATTTRTLARQTLVIYGILTVSGIVIVWMISGQGLMSVNHVLAAVSTGGFSSFDNSLADIDNLYSRFAIISISCCGALPLPLYTEIFSKKWRTGIGDTELIALAVAILSVSLLLFLSLHFYSGFALFDALGHALFLAVSAQSTTGFTTLDLNQLDNGAKLVMVCSMIVGGGVGSTAGGLKLLRLLIFLRLLQVTVQRTTMPSQAVYTPRLGGKVLSDAEIQRVLVLILLYVGVVGVSWLAFLLFGYAPMNALFEVVSASATVGLSTGITTADMPPLLKLVLCLDMLFGRVEIIALLVVLYLPNWIGKRKEIS